jgi:peptidyl-prolyl cis-trans isomerase B (cyclophilin B)
MEVADAIVSGESDGEKPSEDQVMETVEVDTKGYDYPAPAIIE